MKPWEGTHQYVWRLGETEAGNIEAIIQKAKAMGVTGLVVKFANGSLADDTVSQGYMDDFKRIVGSLKAAGLKVGGWIYQYLTDVQGEVDACVQAVQAGADYIVLDAEADIKGRLQEVQQFGQLLRQALPSVPVGLSSFAIAPYHPEVPVNLYAQFVDFMAPQIYWDEMGWDVAVAFNASIASYKGFGKPIAPTGQSCGGATPADMAKFVQLCRQQGFEGISWWDWQEASVDQWNAIAANLIKPPTEVASTAPCEAESTPPWYAEAEAYVLAQGLMHKDKEGNFNPDEPVTRAVLAQVLYNLSKKQ